MKAVFQIEADSPRQVEVDFNTLIVAGWAWRDLAAIEHHIEELAAIGVPRPTSVPLYYPVGEAGKWDIWTRDSLSGEFYLADGGEARLYTMREKD